MINIEELGNSEKYELGTLPGRHNIYLNVKQNVIVITEDRLRLHLLYVTKILDKKYLWISPAGILITVILTLVTADFKKFYLEKTTWQAIFIIIGLASFIFMVWCLCQLKKSENIDSLVAKIKAEGGTINPNNKE